MTRTNPSSATASPAASSPDFPAPGGLCAIHQPNLFPRLPTLAKLFAADYWIVLDDVEFARRDYQHRARLAALGDPLQRQWLSIPTHLPQGRPTLIRDTLIADPNLARRRTAGMLRQNYGVSPHWPVLAHVLEPVLDAFDSGRTAIVAQTSTRVLLDLLGWKGQILRSSELPARPGRSQRLADLAAAAGARWYLCGTGGTDVGYRRRATFAPPQVLIWHPGRTSGRRPAQTPTSPGAASSSVRRASTAAVYERGYQRGLPPKMLLAPASPLQASTTLAGWRRQRGVMTQPWSAHDGAAAASARWQHIPARPRLRIPQLSFRTGSARPISVLEGVLRLLLGLTNVTFRLFGAALGSQTLVAYRSADGLLHLALGLFRLGLGLLVLCHDTHIPLPQTQYNFHLTRK